MVFSNLSFPNREAFIPSQSLNESAAKIIMKIAIFSAIVAAIALTTSEARPASLFKRSCDPNVLSCSGSSANSCCSPTYGVLVLVQQWIPGYGPSDAFTMHGLWPDTCNGGQAPSKGCDTSRAYTNIDTILSNYGDSQLYSDMNTYWPSDAGSNNKFWSHEWDKHGTCVSTLAPTCYDSSFKKYEDVHDYFQQALSLRAQYDLYSALNSASIQPGSTPDANDIHNAIQSAFGQDAKVDCDSNGNLQEIWLYFNVQGTSTYQLTSPLDTGSCSGATAYNTK